MPTDGLHFRTEMQEDSAVVYCSGKLTAGQTEPLRAEVKDLFSRTKTVVLDFTGLTHMDSMGLGAIVGLYVSAKGAGCEFTMVNFGERVRRLLIVTNLLSVFEEYGRSNIRMP